MTTFGPCDRCAHSINDHGPASCDRVRCYCNGWRGTVTGRTPAQDFTDGLRLAAAIEAGEVAVKWRDPTPVEARARDYALGVLADVAAPRTSDTRATGARTTGLQVNDSGPSST